jgi:hypothetical protein
MHAVLANHINAILAQAIALEQHEEAISQVLGILGCSGATGIRLCGGGEHRPFIVADLADDPVALGEIEAALASVNIWFTAATEARNRHYSSIPGTTPSDGGVGVTLLLQIVPAASKAA